MSNPKDTISSCVLFPTGVPKLHSKGVSDLVFNFTRKEAEEELRHKRPGALVLRLDKDTMIKNGGKSISIIVSYKFNTIVVHRNLPIKVTAKVHKKTNDVQCKMPPNQLRHVTAVLWPFLRNLSVFICTVTRNPNWIEKELQQRELEREMSFRSFVIFPSRHHIVIIKKTKSNNAMRHKSISILINLEQCTFLVESGDKPEPSSSTFDKILLSFLEVNESNTFFVKRALGYDVEKFRKEMEEEERTSSLVPLAQTSKNFMVIEKEKKVTLSVIYLSTCTARAPLTEYPKEVRRSLATILKAVKTLNGISSSKTESEKIAQQALYEEEKMEWVHNGTFKVMLNLICAGSEGSQKKEFAPIEICSHLLVNCQQACRVFFITFWDLIEKFYPKRHQELVKLFHTLTKLISVKPLPFVFIRESGVPRLLSLYTKVGTDFGQKSPQILMEDQEKTKPRKENSIFKEVHKHLSNCKDGNLRTRSIGYKPNVLPQKDKPPGTQILSPIKLTKNSHTKFQIESRSKTNPSEGIIFVRRKSEGSLKESTKKNENPETDTSPEVSRKRVTQDFVEARKATTNRSEKLEFKLGVMKVLQKTKDSSSDGSVMTDSGDLTESGSNPTTKKIDKKVDGTLIDKKVDALPVSPRPRKNGFEKEEVDQAPPVPTERVPKENNKDEKRVDSDSEEELDNIKILESSIEITLNGTPKILSEMGNKSEGENGLETSSKLNSKKIIGLHKYSDNVFHISSISPKFVPHLKLPSLPSGEMLVTGMKSPKPPILNLSNLPEKDSNTHSLTP